MPKINLIVPAIAIAWLAIACSPQAPISSAETTIPHLDDLVAAVSSGSNEDLLPLVRFSSLPCTRNEGMGGPPKCLPAETEGALVEVLPILGPEGGYIRHSEFGTWSGLGVAQLYAAFRNSAGAYSDEFFPAGDFGVVFLPPDKASVVIFQITDDGIVRVDYPALPSFEDVLKDNEVILGPYPPPE